MSPTLSQVISSGNEVSITSGLAFILGGGAFLVAAVVSAVKGYTVYRNKKDGSSISISTDSPPDLLNLELNENREKIDEMSFMIDELKHELDGLLAEKETIKAKNESLAKELEEHIDNFDGLKLSYDILYRNNFKTAKECEKLKTENEKLSKELERTKKGRTELHFGKPVKLIPFKARKESKIKKAETMLLAKSESTKLKKEGNRKLKVSKQNVSKK
ncbi:MAG: hypothetical protein WCV91_03840 [Candidatus Margulisiibacteriota bacterium]